MRVLVTGAAGQLGQDVLNSLRNRGHEVIGTDIAAGFVPMDITNKDEVQRVFVEIKPDAVIHCAAWTAVDAAEEELNRAKVYLINAVGTKNIAEASRQIDAKMMYISTDYVFNGQGDQPWDPDCSDFSPLNVYGKSKLEGERAVRQALDRFFIVRIAWVFGRNGNNFVKTMLKLGKTHDQISVVNDQIGTPTYTYDLARLLSDMIESEEYGFYHATNEGGYLSWADFAEEIFKLLNMAVTVRRVTTAEYGLNKAARPYNSRLDKSKLLKHGFYPLPPWQDALWRYLKEEDHGTDQG